MVTMSKIILGLDAYCIQRVGFNYTADLNWYYEYILKAFQGLTATPVHLVLNSTHG